MGTVRFSLAQKIWLLVSIVIVGTLLISYLLFHYFYQQIYVNNVQETLTHEGFQLAHEYAGGPIHDDLRKQIEWYNSVSQTDVLLVDNPKDLAACLPYEVDVDTLITEEDRDTLLTGDVVVKLGYETRFQRQIMGVIVPLLDDLRLAGIIYLYVPLASVEEVNNDAGYIWLLAAILYIVLSIFLGKLVVEKLTNPLRKIEKVAIRLSKGDFSETVDVQSNDEIGQLAHTFNQMIEAIRNEDHRKKEFISTVSHELRTPLSYVQGYSEAILEGMVTSKDKERGYLQIILKEAKRMKRLVNDLLDLSLLESGDFPINKTPLVLAQLIEDTLQTYAPIFAEKQLKLKLSTDPEVVVEADADRIEQVLHNLLDNAVRYSPEQSAITVSMSGDESFCTISIQDTGCGISEEDLQYLGEKFFRVNKARTRKDGGTGLGLAITKRIIEYHNGSIQFVSSTGKGTTVLITLPVLKV
ncbi:sensor histidine kinase [Bacillus sp. HMF5848]|uniref:sensor histidine kinase n=1 Tax=Bacillus sp. HMF5848 TaxID=2495421 RepID=UPI000F78F6DF|nr:HAMP domain-containing sensor histidine kinase [Bacillus sp. HMF5848]RSK28396.1 sensor histidine kinase [Bacillus sp. HMF5848]